MIIFEQNGPKQWTVIYDEEQIALFLSPSSITNKFYLITDFLQRVSTYCGTEFDEWFMTLLRDCHDENLRAKAVTSNIDNMKKFANAYITSINTDYSQFVDESKAKKSSILFQADEIEKIIRLSSCLKIYSVISNNENLKLGQKLHKDVYNKIASDIANTDIIYKIFNVVKTKTFRYNMTDKFMWDYIKTIQCKDIGVHIIEIFNFIMNNILILCEEDKNPITYFVGVVDESVKWFLRSVYKGSIVYDDSVSTEDIQGINVDNLKTYCYNDTLGRLKGIAYEKLYDTLEKENVTKLDQSELNDEHLLQFHNRISDINYISPLCECLVFPVLSKISKIPYYHFKTLSPEHSAVISSYMKELFVKAFKGDYKSLFSLLDYYPVNPPSVSTTYTIKSIHYYLDTQQDVMDFYGFNTKILPHKALCHFVGRVSRINFCNIISGKKLAGIPLSKVESDMIHFYTLYFANKLEDKIQEMVVLLNKDF